MLNSDSPFDDFDDQAPNNIDPTTRRADTFEPFDDDTDSSTPLADDDTFTSGAPDDPFADDDTFTSGAPDDPFADDDTFTSVDQFKEPSESPPEPPPAPTIRPSQDSEPASPSITRVEPAEEPIEAVTYDDSDFEDVAPATIPFMAPSAEDVFISGKTPAKEAQQSSALSENPREQRKAQKRARRASEDYGQQRERERDRRDQAEARKEKQRQDAEARKRASEAKQQQRKEKAEKRRQREERKAERKQKAPKQRPERLRAAAQDNGGASSMKDLIPAAAVIMGLVAVGGVGAALLRGGDDPETPTTEAAGVTSPQEGGQTQEPAGVAASPADKLRQVVDSRCTGGSENETVTNEAGSTSSAIGAIQGFNYAYFTEKDAESAAEYLDRSMYNSISSLQEGIDSDQNGDAYCLHITPESRTVYSVGVVEFVEPETADGDVLSWRTDQQVTLERKGSDWVIVRQVIES